MMSDNNCIFKGDLQCVLIDFLNVNSFKHQRSYSLCPVGESVKRNSKIPKGQTEIVKLEDRQDHGQHINTMKHKTNRIQNTTLKTKTGVTRTLLKISILTFLPFSCIILDGVDNNFEFMLPGYG